MIGGDILVLDIERPAHGGWMIGRFDGQVVLVAGAIPGERARVRIERRARGVVFGAVVEVLDASPDRRPPDGDAECGGRAYAHIDYPRQLALKRELVIDALQRVGRGLDADVRDVVPSPCQGYRLRARLHWQRGRLGFFRERTHDVCHPRTGGQLLASTIETISAIADALRALRLQVDCVDLVENMPATERVIHVHLRQGDPVRAATSLKAVSGLTGVIVDTAGRRDATTCGSPWVVDEFTGSQGPWTLRHRPQSFFQANRFLLPDLIRFVIEALEGDSVVDLFAGVGLFGLAAAAERRLAAILVEAEAANVDDLRANAQPLDAARIQADTVEDYLERGDCPVGASIIVDPPRVGLSPQVRTALVEREPRQIVYVSCDPATFARDARALVEGGMRLGIVRPLDLFPATPHVELVAVFERG